MMKLSKEHKKARDNLEKFSRSVIVQFSFGRIKTYYDLYRVAGYSDEAVKQRYFPSEYNKTITRQDVLEYLSDRMIELTTAQYLEVNPPIITYEKEEETEVQKEVVDTATDALSNHPADTLVDKAVETPTKYLQAVPAEEEPKPKEKFITSPNESPDIFFFWFQKDAIMKMLNGILKGE